MMRVFALQLLLCVCVLATVKIITERDRHPWVCDVEVAHEVRRSGDKFELVTKVSMDHEHYNPCIMEQPLNTFWNRLVCNVHIREEIPSNLFVDLEELKSLEYKTNYRGFTAAPIDTEASANDSSPFTLDLFVADAWPNPDWLGYPDSFELTLHMPFHLRQQTPASDVTHLDFEIPPPSRVAIKCVTPQITQEWDPVESRKHHTLPPPHGLAFLTEMTTNYFNALVTSSTWQELKVQLTEPLKFSVAVDSLPPKRAARSPTMALGVGGTAVLLIALAVWKVASSSSSSSGGKKGSRPATKKASTKKSKKAAAKND